MPKKKVVFRLLTEGRPPSINLMHGLSISLRFRNVPTFGRGTIRRFVDNVSEMKKLAGWDFKDILQVAIFTTTFLSPDCSISTATTVHNPCLWGPSAPRSQQRHAGSPVWAHNMACVSETPNSHRQDARPAWGCDKDPHKCNVTVPLGGVRSFSYPGTLKGGWSTWTTCGSACIKGGQPHSQKESKNCPKVEEI